MNDKINGFIPKINRLSAVSPIVILMFEQHTYESNISLN